MKRRKTFNKYTVGEFGQITNNRPVLSDRTIRMLQIMSFAEALSSIGSIGVDEKNDDVIETPCDDDPVNTSDDNVKIE